MYGVECSESEDDDYLENSESEDDDYLDIAMFNGMLSATLLTTGLGLERERNKPRIRGELIYVPQRRQRSL
jgi:hypothetical protein